ncbi:hypothetical protein [Butyrivibrio sp. AE2032]|uniref:hypothetical protein n=1 Tax=Butyrivibrio sp. AE2032 TaxID=1458463 RepID=UPI0016395F87|nr:hypothetical protein [Butyrivibrio sp. AE2032]
MKKFKRIYEECIKNYSKEKYLVDLLEIYIKNSIAETFSHLLDIELIRENHYHSRTIAYSKYGDEIIAHDFVRQWIVNSSWQRKPFIDACYEILDYLELEAERSEDHKASMGIYLSKLSDWMDFSDDEVRTYIDNLIDEVSLDKYDYWDFFKILDTLLFFKDMGLFNGAIEEVVKLMEGYIQKSTTKCIENPFRLYSESTNKVRVDQYYLPLMKMAKEHNDKLKKNSARDKGTFDSADMFCKYCIQHRDDFLNDRSFINFLGRDSILELIKNSSGREQNEMASAFRYVFKFSNVWEYFGHEIDDFKDIRNELAQGNYFGEGITDGRRKNHFIEIVDEIIERLKVPSTE